MERHIEGEMHVNVCTRTPVTFYDCREGAGSVVVVVLPVIGEEGYSSSREGGNDIPSTNTSLGDSISLLR